MTPGPAKRLVIYVGENQRWHHKPAWREIVDLCRKHGLAGTTATRGLLGFGPSGKMHEDLTPDVMPDLPITIEAIDEAEKIDRALPDLDLIVQDGLIAVHDTQVIKARPRKQKVEAGPMQHQKLTGKSKMLRVHTGANDLWEGEPLHLALVKRFHQLDLLFFVCQRIVPVMRERAHPSPGGVPLRRRADHGGGGGQRGEDREGVAVPRSDGGQRAGGDLRRGCDHLSRDEDVAVREGP